LHGSTPQRLVVEGVGELRRRHRLGVVRWHRGPQDIRADRGEHTALCGRQLPVAAHGVGNAAHDQVCLRRLDAEQRRRSVVDAG
jgi:hypothetical protein